MAAGELEGPTEYVMFRVLIRGDWRRPDIDRICSILNTIPWRLRRPDIDRICSILNTIPGDFWIDRICSILNTIPGGFGIDRIYSILNAIQT